LTDSCHLAFSKSAINWSHFGPTASNSWPYVTLPDFY